MAFNDLLSDWSNQPTYPDMTPGPSTDTPPPASKPVTILDKTWHFGDTPTDPATQRIRGAAIQAWNEAQPTPEGLNAANSVPVVGPWLLKPAAKAFGALTGGLGAAGAAGAATVSELLQQAGVPESATRDLNIASQVVPAGMSTMLEASPTAGRTIPIPGTNAKFDNPMFPRPIAEPPVVSSQTMPSYMQPVVQARQVTRDQVAPLAAAIDKLRPGYQAPPPPGPMSSPTGIQGPLPPPSGYVPPGPPRITPLGQAGDIAGQYYRMNDALAGGQLADASITNSVMDKLKAAGPLPGLPSAIAGPDNPASVMYNRAVGMGLRDQPQTLAQLQGTYRELGDAVGAEYGADGLSERGKALWDIQRDLRDQIAPSGLQGGDPWSNARLAWSQQMKLDDLQRMQQRALMTQNPQTSIQNQIKNMITNDKKMRGYTTEEQDALQTAGESGVLSNVIRPFASRLLPTVVASTVGGGIGSLLGPWGAAAGIGLGGLAGEAVREPMALALRNIQLNKLQNAMDVINKRVPPPPATGWTAPP